MVPEWKSKEAASAIQEFVAGCELPALLECGEAPLALLEDNFRVELSGRGLWLEAWDDKRLWSRRILSAKGTSRKRLELEAFRFGKKPVRVTLVDVADARANAALEKVHRSAFAERFRLFLNRQFGTWRLEEFRSEANLEKSQSPLYPGALYTKGNEAVVAVAAPPRDTSFHALTFALIFVDSIRRRHGAICASRLLLYLPEEYAQPVVSLARHLDCKKLKVEIWTYGEDGAEVLLDPADRGNLESRLALRGSRLGGPAWWIEVVTTSEGVEALEEADGGISYRVRGYEVARLRPGFGGNGLPQIHWGPKLRHQAEEGAASAIRKYFQEVGRRRRAGTETPLDPVFLAAPERWLESSVRAGLTEIEASLGEEVYGQVLETSEGDSGTVDLLAIDRTGRLAVLELKATEDIHLPLQAFDYWLRLCRHLHEGSFRAAGYFPHRELAAEPPRLLLVAPALHFHPTTQAVLSFLPPECETTVVGLSANWRQRTDVALRM